MSALKAYRRDLDICPRLGDPQLRLPTDGQLLNWVADLLCQIGAPQPTQAKLLFARWKPGTAVLGSWQVAFDDGSQRMIVWKAYTGSKAEDLGSSLRVDEAMLDALGQMAPFAYLPEHSGHLTCFPVDRVLRGAARIMDMRRLGRLLDASGIWSGKVMRRQSSQIELLRHKPEHRAVFCLRAKLKNDRQGPRVSAGSRTLAVRVLSPTDAKSVISNRLSGPNECFPKLVHFEEEQGLLFEEWIEGQPVTWNDFSQAAPSARLLLDLHKESFIDQPRKHSRSGALELLARLPGLVERVSKIPELGPTRRSHWIHGDFHPDQLIQGRHGLRLLDADALRTGAPEEDFASWVSDRIRGNLDISFQEALAPLLEGYGARSESLDLGLLAQLTTEQLIHRAAAGLRRLQMNAEPNAVKLVERARTLSSETILR